MALLQMLSISTGADINYWRIESIEYVKGGLVHVWVAGYISEAAAHAGKDFVDRKQVALPPDSIDLSALSSEHTIFGATYDALKALARSETPGDAAFFADATDA